MKKNAFLAFAEKQEILDNLSITLKKMYEDDKMFDNSESLKVLTEQTYNVMEYMETVKEGLSTDMGILTVAENFDVEAEQLVKDVAEIILMSTVAMQAMTIETLTDSLNED